MEPIHSCFWGYIHKKEFNVISCWDDGEQVVVSNIDTVGSGNISLRSKQSVLLAKGQLVNISEKVDLG
jgi:hypothetical protein